MNIGEEKENLKWKDVIRHENSGNTVIFLNVYLLQEG